MRNIDIVLAKHRKIGTMTIAGFSENSAVSSEGNLAISTLSIYQNSKDRGTCMAQLVKHLLSAQVPGPEPFSS